MTSFQEKPPVYLLDSMAFIFRAYHAMQRRYKFFSYGDCMLLL